MAATRRRRAREAGGPGALLGALDAVRRGDFSARVPVRGSATSRRMATALNAIIQLNARTTQELERLAEAVGQEGRIGERARVDGAVGAWAAQVAAVNVLVAALAQPTTEVGRVIGAVATGDLSQRVALEVEGRGLKGEFLRTARVVNGMVEQLGSFASEVTRVAREVGTEGKLGGQAVVRGVGGTWKDLTDNVNSMASNLTTQVRNIAQVTTAVARGDLTKHITVDVRGELEELKETINTMVDQLSSFASEVTRVAREVGTEGKLGGQAVVGGLGGTWKDLTDNVNSMALNLTTQVRGIATVVTHVASGDLKRKLVLEVKGEIAELADTMNGMIDTLAVFADQVTTVAREVGIEGKLGGQARVPGADGIWRDLTDNVNQLAANLTTQVRAIAEVATAVTTGDLTRFITVGAQGEVAALKDNINQMIRNLKDTTRRNTEQDWLKTNLARFTRMLQGERDLLTVSRAILSRLAPLVGARYGAFYVRERVGAQDLLVLRAGYARQPPERQPTSFQLGEGLVGQCAADQAPILVSDAPDGYVRIGSGLGEAPATHLLVLPVLFEGGTRAVIELASFQRFSDVHLDFLTQLTESIGIVLHTIGTNMRTESLLAQSQALTEELTEINQRLEQQKAEVERKNHEVELAKRALEEKAEQLALASRYKSEFLANVSHELRTPLNSLLLLSAALSENREGHLSPRQVEYATSIHASGSELLELINEILDLAKIESGTVAVEAGPVVPAELEDFAERSFRQVAERKGLAFGVSLDAGLPPALHTDVKRLQQILRNLLSNAFKFTERGEVQLSVAPARGGWSPAHPGLGAGGPVVAFSVRDTGIGIPPEKHQLIFEAFRQADGTTSRKYGGTGLGLSICRELAQLLGGEIRVESEQGAGSTFTLYLPAGAGAPEAEAHRHPRAGEGAAPAPAPAEAGRRLAGHRVLVVDDDVRNIFALTAVLERQGLEVLHAESAREGLALLEAGPRVDLLLMDVMMPELDGYQAMTAIRARPHFAQLPIVALTARAMKGDREKCLAAGASDYIAKPVDTERLFAVLETWLGPGPTAEAPAPAPAPAAELGA